MEQQGWGAPAPRAAPRPAPTRSYGGIPDRLGGLILDGLILSLAQIPVAIVFYLLTWLVTAALSSSETCRRFDPTRFDSVQSQVDACNDGAVWWFVALVVLQLIVNLWIWWRLIPGRMVRRGASVGMGIAGLEIEEEESDLPIGALRSLARVLLAGFLPLAFAMVPLLIVLAIVGIEPERAEVMVLGVLVLLVIAGVGYLLPWLWALWDAQNQTLYDKLAGTVVTGPAGPIRPWTVVSLVSGLLAVMGLLPLGLLAIFAAHLGLKDMHGTRGQYKGRGAARAGQVLGWLATVAMVVLLVIAAFVYREEQRDEACRADADRLREAAVEFQLQQGRPPASDAELVFAGQLDEESDRYEVGTDFGELEIFRQDRSCPPA